MRIVVHLRLHGNHEHAHSHRAVRGLARDLQPPGTFTIPKGSQVDDSIYFWEGWTPASANCTVLCNLQAATLLETIRDLSLIALGTGGGVVTNYLQNKFKVIPTSALCA